MVGIREPIKTGSSDCAWVITREACILPERGNNDNLDRSASRHPPTFKMQEGVPSALPNALGASSLCQCSSAAGSNPHHPISTAPRSGTWRGGTMRRIEDKGQSQSSPRPILPQEGCMPLPGKTRCTHVPGFPVRFFNLGLAKKIPHGSRGHSGLPMQSIVCALRLPGGCVPAA